MIAIYDHDLPVEYIGDMKKALEGCVFLPFYPEGARPYPSIRSHPDIYFFQADENTMVYAPCVPDKMLDELSANGIDLVKGARDPGDAYPLTALYNALVFDGYLIGNLSNLDIEVVRLAEARDLKKIHIEQSYSRCSILPVGTKALVTADRGIYRALKDEGIDIMLIPPGDIILPGHAYGFIGGAGGRMTDGGSFILGSLDGYPGGRSIREYHGKYDVKIIELERLPLYDAGTVIFLDGRPHKSV